MKKKVLKNCPICQNNLFTKKFTYSKKPKVETNFEIKNYSRAYFLCNICEHWSSNVSINEKFYRDFYVNKTYKNDFFTKFKRIIKLGKNSDNFYRCKRIDSFLKKN